MNFRSEVYRRVKEYFDDESLDVGDYEFHKCIDHANSGDDSDFIIDNYGIMFYNLGVCDFTEIKSLGGKKWFLWHENLDKFKDNLKKFYNNSFKEYAEEYIEGSHTYHEIIDEKQSMVKEVFREHMEENIPLLFYVKNVCHIEVVLTGDIHINILLRDAGWHLDMHGATVVFQSTFVPLNAIESVEIIQ